MAKPKTKRKYIRKPLLLANPNSPRNFSVMRAQLERQLADARAALAIENLKSRMSEDIEIQQAQQLLQNATAKAQSEAPSGTRLTFATGATRQAAVAGDGDQFPLRYDLLLGNVDALKRLALTYGEGSLKYSPNNWKKGFPESVLVNHAMAHIMQYADGDTTEDHLAHAAWNLLTLMHQQKHHPELMDMTGDAPKEA